MPELNYFFMIPAAGFLSDLALITFFYRSKQNKRYRKPLILFYFCLAIWNFGVMFLYIAETESKARLTLYLMHHIHVFMPSSFLWIAVRLSGRKFSFINFFAFAASFFFLFWVEYSYWFTGDTSFIKGVVKFPWGYYPIHGQGTRYYDWLFRICIPIGFFYLFKPAEKAHPYIRSIRFLLIIFWVSAISSFLPLYGISIYPLGNAVDTIISAFIIFILVKDQVVTTGEIIWIRFCGLLSSASLGLIVAYLATEFLPGSPLIPLFTACASSVTSLFVFQKLFPVSIKNQSQSDTRPVFPLLQLRYQLTYQESMICELLQKGKSRTEILMHLNISPATMKTHLKSVYRKTIERKNSNPLNDRDKLQRLTVFLNSVARESKG